MAKKRSERSSTANSPESRSDTRNDEAITAGVAVERAKAALRRAERVYEQACEAGTERVAKTRALTVGDILDGTMEFVRRHPAAGVLTAGLIGFLLGRPKKR